MRSIAAGQKAVVLGGGRRRPRIHTRVDIRAGGWAGGTRTGAQRTRRPAAAGRGGGHRTAHDLHASPAGRTVVPDSVPVAGGGHPAASPPPRQPRPPRRPAVAAATHTSPLPCPFRPGAGRRRRRSPRRAPLGRPARVAERTPRRTRPRPRGVHRRGARPHRPRGRHLRTPRPRRARAWRHGLPAPAPPADAACPLGRPAREAVARRCRRRRRRRRRSVGPKQCRQAGRQTLGLPGALAAGGVLADLF